jgi:hypothetical protein
MFAAGANQRPSQSKSLVTALAPRASSEGFHRPPCGTPTPLSKSCQVRRSRKPWPVKTSASVHSRRQPLLALRSKCAHRASTRGLLLRTLSSSPLHGVEREVVAATPATDSGRRNPELDKNHKTTRGHRQSVPSSSAKSFHRTATNQPSQAPKGKCLLAFVNNDTTSEHFVCCRPGAWRLRASHYGESTRAATNPLDTVPSVQYTG